MKQRIMAAWKVLRGEWTASAPKPSALYVDFEPSAWTSTATTSNPVTFSWTARK